MKITKKYLKTLIENEIKEAQNTEIIDLLKNNPQAEIINDELKNLRIPHFIIDDILLKAFSGDGYVK